MDNVLEPCDAKAMEILIRYLRDSSEVRDYDIFGIIVRLE